MRKKIANWMLWGLVVVVWGLVGWLAWVNTVVWLVRVKGW